MNRPTQVDVAKRAGVSRATVSYVLNGATNKGVPISAETQQRVWDAIEELGYEPHAQARSLRSGGATKTIGILIPDVRNPHYWEMMEGFELEARQWGYHVMMYSSELSGERGITILRALAGRRIDGIIIIGSYVTYSKEAQIILNQLLKQQLPIVLGNFDYETDCLHSDYRQATTELLHYLYGLGHRQISLLYGVAPDEEALDRLEPYKAFLNEHQLPLLETSVIECGPTIRDGYLAACRIFSVDSPPTALVCVNDWLAMGAIRAAHEYNLRVPDDISISGYDGINLGEYMTPSLTTVSWDTIKWSREAFRFLVRRLEDPNEDYQKVTIPHEVLIRESTGAAPQLPASTWEERR